MKKHLLAATMIPVLLVLAGAGCDQLTNLYQSPTSTGPDTTSTTATNTTPDPAQNSLTLTAAVLNPGIVQLKWQAPENFDINHTFFLLHSAKAEPVYPGAFYFRKGSTDREAAWGNIPAGVRHFRVCEADGDKCVSYSNIVDLEIK